MKKLALVAVVVLAAVVVVAVGSQASTGQSSVRADLNGYQENVSISTTGVGAFTATINDEEQLIEYELTYSASRVGTRSSRTSISERGTTTAASQHSSAAAATSLPAPRSMEL